MSGSSLRPGNGWGLDVLLEVERGEGWGLGFGMNAIEECFECFENEKGASDIRELTYR